jgi:hypothetical protein
VAAFQVVWPWQLPPPPSLSLPSGDPGLWRQRVSGWGDSLVGLETLVALPLLSLLHLRMATSGQAWRFQGAKLRLRFDDQRQVSPWWGVQPGRSGCLSCSPPPLVVRNLVYLEGLRWSLVMFCLWLRSIRVHPHGHVASCPEPCVLCALACVVCVVCGCACDVFFVLGQLFSFFCLIQRYTVLPHVREK